MALQLKRKSKAREYREKNPIKYAESQKKWKEANREKTKAYSKEYRRNNLEKSKECQRRWGKNNPEKVKEANLKRTFGITLEQYNLILEEQNYRCAICETEKSQDGKSFAVDHNHETGEIRGLLCNNCNTGIGMLKDSEKLLLKAASYLINN